MKLMKAMLWAMLALFFCASAHARLLLITSQENALYQEFHMGLAFNSPNKLPLEIDAVLAVDLATVASFSAYSAIVVAGVEAAKALSERDSVNRPVIYTMLPQANYEWLVEKNRLVGQHKVLYIDQPPLRYVQLVRAVIPGMTALGYLYGDTSAIYVAEVKKAAEGASLEFVSGDVSANVKLSNLLKESFSNSDAVLLLPDPHLYNRRVVQEVLLASFRYKRPLVVYSASLLKAGAMAALFSTPQQIGRQTAELLGCLGQPCYSAIPQRSYPKYFSVSLNEVVVRQMEVKVKSAEELQKYLESVEILGLH